MYEKEDMKEQKKTILTHLVTSNQQDNISIVVNGKLWGLTACGWVSESGRSRGGRVQHHHLPPLTSLMCFWLHPTYPTATTTTSEWNILHSPALHCFKGHVWYLADAEILLLVYFFFNLLFSAPISEEETQRTVLAGEEGWIVFKTSAPVHLSPQSWSDVVGQRGRLLSEVYALFCRIHMVGAF